MQNNENEHRSRFFYAHFRFYNPIILNEKHIIHLVLTILSNHFLFAQDAKFIARGNLSVGTNYEYLDYNGGLIAYSPGGGIGLEIGLERNLVGKLKHVVLFIISVSDFK